MQKRMHNREFNLEVVRQIASGQKRPAQACREYSLADSVLSFSDFVMLSVQRFVRCDFT